MAKSFLKFSCKQIKSPLGDEVLNAIYVTSLKDGLEEGEPALVAFGAKSICNEFELFEDIVATLNKLWPPREFQND